MLGKIPCKGDFGGMKNPIPLHPTKAIIDTKTKLDNIMNRSRP